jgi:predicted HAD superfamily Cof-like phosphohydrolase
VWHFFDVKDFQQKFSQIVNEKPVHLTKRKLEERLKFMQEELDEFEAGVIEQDLAQQADALVDIVYVALGTAVMLGLPWNELWNDVHRANMAKVPGQTHRGNLVDVMKPEGWVGPKTVEILISAGYDESRKHEEQDDAVHY